MKIKCTVLPAAKRTSKTGESFYIIDVFCPSIPAILPVFSQVPVPPGDAELALVMTQDRKSLTFAFS